jgi:hypothetical protein
MQINMEQGVDQLRKQGISIEDENETVLDLARKNKRSPQQIYMILKELNAGKELIFPDIPPQGTGRKTIRIICDQYNLDLEALLTYLNQQQIKAEPDMALRTIAEEHQKKTVEIFDLIKEFTQQ